MAHHHSWGLVEAQLPRGVEVMWNYLPHDAVEDIVGFTHDGTPLRELLDALGVEVGEGVRKSLILGVASGLNARQTARLIRQKFGMGLARSLRIARTETMRAYRETTWRNYQENDDIVKGWIWQAHLGTRTCPACIAMHGTKHQLDERLDDHPNGRCVMIPLIHTWRDLGFDVPEPSQEYEAGADWFAKQDEETQRKILGDARFSLWQSGTVTLQDFVSRKRSARWGTTRYAKSATAVVGNHN